MPRIVMTASVRSAAGRVALAAGVAAGLAGPGAAAPLPDAVAVTGKKVVMQLHAEGAQVYQCTAGADGAPAWKLREPIATLMRDGQTLARHFTGPTWEAADGSAVVGKVAGQAPGGTPADIAWLRLDVVGHRGEGVLSPVTAVQRINTRGGAYAGPCSPAGTLHVEPYSADYVFLGP